MGIYIKNVTYYKQGQKPRMVLSEHGVSKYSNEIDGFVDASELLFADAPWALIKQIVNDGLAENYFALGDEKDCIGKDGFHRIFRIVSFSHYAENDMAIEQKTIIAYLQPQWSSGYDDEGYENNYSISSMRTSLQNILNGFYPNDLANVISSTSYKVAKNGASDSEVLTLTDKLFLGAAKEYSETPLCVENEANALSQFTFYKTNSGSSFRVKKNYDGNTSYSYWLRSPGVSGVGNKNLVCYIGASGYMGSFSISTTRYNIAPVFTLKPEE